ncbi:MAG: thiamine pyrophosphate-dependent dehydrogenase E1 component subunit alpha [Candidatus Portnoybacteria bacterium]|nr:thiamine pyrophosphate-dependent dehydrogenase E1 component subunit alpha [Candidatus Portnoybacteria bacterium]
MEFNIEGMQPELLKEMYESMVKIRKVEEKIGEVLLAGEVITPTHLYIGQEAVAVGACKALTINDYVFSNYRGHGHYLAKGGDLNKMIAELYGKSSGASKGKGGSMHLVAPDVSIVAVNTAIVGSQISHATGAALAIKLRGENKVSLVFFGDAGAETGIFFESTNFAALKKLPVIFVCENNFYSSHAPLSERQPIKDIYLKTKHIMPSFQIDGNNIVEIFKTVQEAVKRARNGEGSTFIECITYRHRGHVGPNLDIEDAEMITEEERTKWAKLTPIKLVEKATRTKEELDKWLALDPIKHFEKYLIEKNILTNEEKEKLNKKLSTEIENAVEFARKSAYPTDDQLTNDVYAK